ncbi:unnamed protein product [Moneuplotes crassus]|uniref:Uncharacterized protein n=1 Tax=Euplotes crassus TaxID=5936 RepID=A0AAD2CX62_EUPCR|nr:unnamed protein product [Moneuplotes crassus]
MENNKSYTNSKKINKVNCDDIRRLALQDLNSSRSGRCRSSLPDRRQTSFMGLEDSFTPEKSVLFEVESYRRCQELNLEPRSSLCPLRNGSRLGEIVMPALPKSPPLGKYSGVIKKFYDVSDQKGSSKCRGLVILNNKSIDLFTILEPKILKSNGKGRNSLNVSSKGGKKLRSIQVLKLRKKSKLGACKLLMKDSTLLTSKTPSCPDHRRMKILRKSIIMINPKRSQLPSKTPAKQTKSCAKKPQYFFTFNPSSL